MSRARKILFVDTGNEFGGGIASLLMLVRGLDRARLAPLALFYSDFPAGPAPVSALFESLDTPFYVQEPRKPGYYKPLKEAVRFATLGSKRAVRRLDRALVGARLTDALKGAIAQIGPDLVHTNNQPSSNFEVLRAARELGLPVVQHLRKIVTLFPEEVSLANRAARAFVSVSRATRDAYSSQGIDPSRVRVVYNGVEVEDEGIGRSGPEARELGLGPGDLVVLTVASFLPFKGQELLLDAARELVGRFPALKMVFIGDGPNLGEVKRRAGSLGVAQNCVFAGFRENAARYFHLADVAVIPSRNESFPRVALEAMAAGVPLVASRVGGIPEQVEEGVTGLLVAPGDGEGLAGSIERLLADPGLRQEMGRAGKERAKRLFSPEAYVSGVTELYGEMLD